MRQSRLTRRNALGLLAGSALSLPGAGWGQGGSGIGGTGIDGGIGGTGIESGIGGTGIFGLIEGFSSIWVNDLRVEIPASAEITLNGRPASELDLALGQTVAVQAVEGADGALQATRIDATFALVGPISQIAQHQGRWIVVILGQRVVVSALTEVGNVAVGDWVTVTGLRDHRGNIQAANILATNTREAVVTGLVSADGSVAGVGVLAADGSELTAGTRATVQGPLTREVQPRIVATAMSTRPVSLFDPGQVSSLILTGLPGEQDGTLFVDGYGIAVPGVVGQFDPNIAGLEGRIHGRFQSQGGRFRSQGDPSASRQPRAPFAGSGRRGPGSQQPHRRHQPGSGSGAGFEGNTQKPRNKPFGKAGSGKGKR
ncbi:MAG: DUF5666 domain-containing protein [Alphaproteobacteria bacterium]